MKKLTMLAAIPGLAMGSGSHAQFYDTAEELDAYLKDRTW